MQGVEHIPALGGQCGEGVTIHIAAGSIRGAVGAVTAHREHRCIPPGQRRNRCKGKLLIPSAEALAGQVDDRLAACDVGQLFPCPAWVRTMEPRKLPASRASQQSWSVSRTGS